MIHDSSYFFFFLLAKDTAFPEFDTFLTILQEEAAARGLDDDILSQLADVIIHVDLGCYFVNIIY